MMLSHIQRLRVAGLLLMAGCSGSRTSASPAVDDAATKRDAVAHVDASTLQDATATSDGFGTRDAPSKTPAEAASQVEASSGHDGGRDAGALDGGDDLLVDASIPDPSMVDGCAASVTDATPGGDLIAPVTSCVIPTAPAAGTVNMKSTVPYGTAPSTPDHSGNSSQTLQIAWPKGDAGLRPLVIEIHGGGWYAGGASLDNATILAGLGYVSASLNYRLVETVDGGPPVAHATDDDFKNYFPAAVSDVRCALRYLRHNAKTYGIDTTRIAVYGTSAGGYLTAMLALATDATGLDDGTCPSELSGESLAIDVAIGFYGPYDLTQTAAFNAMCAATFDTTVIDAFLNGTVDQTTLTTASPITYVTAKAPPMLLFHGSLDPDIPAGQAPELRDALLHLGVPATWIEIPDQGHGFATISGDGGLETSTCTFLALLNEKLSP